jgi:hypothetical protein
MLGAPFSTALDCAGVRKSLNCNGCIFHLSLTASRSGKPFLSGFMWIYPVLGGFKWI